MKNLPAIKNDNDRVKKLDTPKKESWAVHGYSEEIGVSILRKGKVLKVSSYQPKPNNDKQIENKNDK